MALWVYGEEILTIISLQDLGWKPSLELKVGIEKTYKWIYDKVASGESDVK